MTIPEMRILVASRDFLDFRTVVKSKHQQGYKIVPGTMYVESGTTSHFVEMEMDPDSRAAIETKIKLVLEDIDRIFGEGQKIAAVKYLRAELDLCLKDAKDLVETLPKFRR